MGGRRGGPPGRGARPVDRSERPAGTGARRLQRRRHDEPADRRDPDRVGLRNVVPEHVPPTLVRAGAEGGGLAASRAYTRSRIELGVRINLAGADVAALCRGAATAAVRDHVRSQSGDSPTAVDGIVPTEAHFEAALAETEPSGG